MKIILILGLLFVWRVQPYSIIISLIIITLGYSIFLYYSIGRYWYRYMLILVIIRGVLVLFTYIARLIPNERFEYIGLMYVRLFIYLIIIAIMNYNMINYSDIRIILLKIWGILLGVYNLYLVLILLIVIVIVVWLRRVDDGAVRNF